MVDILPFQAIHYNLNKSTNLSKAICPPYDVIGVPEYHRLLQRSPSNMVRVELPLSQGKQDRYAVAADIWQRWIRQRILVQDKEPAYYGYEQRFFVGPQMHVRRGFFAALKVERPGKGHVRPHERTFPKHKEDRLRLMRTTHANISPIFGIFFDRQKKAQALIAREMKKDPLLLARDDKRVSHRIWRWTDPAIVDVLSRIVKPEDVLIADGHHRYETAWNYMQEMLSHDRSPTPSRAYRYVMIFLCPLSDPGLVIQPTHRAVRWVASLEEWKERAASRFHLRSVSSLGTLFARLKRTSEHSSLGMILEGGKMFWLQPKTGNGDLPVVSLHGRILKDIPLENISYGQDPRALLEGIQRSETNAVFLLPPPDKEKFARIAKAGRLLPQKSTYFYPKVTTGLVMRSLEGNMACTPR